MLRRKLTFLFFLFSFSNKIFAQISLEASILDLSSKNPVPFCAVGIKNTTKGCLSNEEGVFKLINVSYSDTLVISSVTYKKKEIVVSELLKTNRILVEAKENMLAEIVVTDNNELLYELFELARARLNSASKQKSKAYFVLESEIGEQPVELLECYYNADFNNSTIYELDFKNGRVGLAPYINRYFISRNTSKAVSFLSLTNYNQHMPVVPFQLNKRKLKKYYLLRLKAIISGSNPVFHVEFEPTQKAEDYFRGEAWIEKNTGTLRKITMNVNNTRTHPFLPFTPEYAEIENVSMQINKSFPDYKNHALLDHLDFNYQLKYHHFKNSIVEGAGRDTVFEVKSKGVIYFYDYDNLFSPPHFAYDKDVEDYRKITSLTFNEGFWSSNNSLVYSERRKKEVLYFKNNGILINYKNNILNKANLDANFFQTSYIVWSDKKRISLKKDGIKNDTTRILKNQEFISQRYKLKAQIFLDINPSGEGLQHYSACLFDVYDSFYNIPEEPVTNCFMNIYFDLVEIERRKMEKVISQNNFSLSQFDSLYQNTIKILEKQSEDYFGEVSRGKNLNALEKWNFTVKQNLGIDNFEMFGVSKPK